VKKQGPTRVDIVTLITTASRPALNLDSIDEQIKLSDEDGSPYGVCTSSEVYNTEIKRSLNIAENNKDVNLI
jgi:hypothetical protein